MARHDGRSKDQLREIKFQKGPQRNPAGSVLIYWGNTHVICSATVEEKVPNWMNASEGKGWITAEYSMLPGSTDRRIGRDRARNNGRTHEIQRLIGRSLRAALPLKSIGPRTITLDCDVIQADGGTRVASITGSYLALRIALQGLVMAGKLEKTPPITQVAAVSIGRVKGEICADLDYIEDSTAELDANVVMNSNLEFIELQGTAEKGSFTRAEWDQLMDSATSACKQIFEIQNTALTSWEIPL